MFNTKLLTLVVIIVATSIGSTQVLAGKTTPQAEVVLRSKLEFVPLNPARGDAAPQAGVLWGDIRKDIPSGVLLKFAPGFSSPPHIHNITYRAVVITGALYNGDENAQKMWMGPGSYWNQPAGAPHITAASKDAGATAFLEILQGPYLVQPTKLFFDNGERPVNVEARNVVWLDASDVTWIDTGRASSAEAAAKMAFLWGRPETGEMNGTFLKLRPGFKGSIRGNGSWLRAVMIEGQTKHQFTGKPDVNNLGPGSYFGSKGAITHMISCKGDENCVIYVRTEGRYEVVPRE
ncbi:MAG: DUF4437 domain-containing protein [Pseudomonadota bacterium]